MIISSFVILGISSSIVIGYMVRSTKKISVLREEINDELKIIK